MDAALRSFRLLKRKLDPSQWFTRGSVPDSSAMVLSPNPTFSTTPDLEAAQASEIGQQNPWSPDYAPARDIALHHDPESLDSGEQVVAVDVPSNQVMNPAYNFNWGGMVIGFCLTSAVEIALQSLQPQIQIPLRVHLFSLAMVFAFSSFFVSNFIPANHFPRFAHALFQLGKFFVFIAFFLAITVPFSLTFKLISWSVFVISLLFIVYAAVTSSGRPRHA